MYLPEHATLANVVRRQPRSDRITAAYEKEVNALCHLPLIPDPTSRGKYARGSVSSVHNRSARTSAGCEMRRAFVEIGRLLIPMYSRRTIDGKVNQVR
jgi:hypothetical protein